MFETSNFMMEVMLLLVLMFTNGHGDMDAIVETNRQTSPFWKVFYLNMDDPVSVHRREQLEPVLRKANVFAQRWNASQFVVHPDDFARFAESYASFARSERGKSDDFITSKLTTFKGVLSLSNTLAALLRHIQELHGPDTRDLARGLTTDRRILVLEDDVILAPEFLVEATLALEQLPDGWDVARFSCSVHNVHPFFFRAISIPNHINVGKEGADAIEIFETGAENDTYKQTCRSTMFDAKTNPNGHKSRCTFCGGTHATVYRLDRLANILDVLETNYRSIVPHGIDCMMSSVYHVNSYCMQLPSVTLGNHESLIPRDYTIHSSR